MFYKNMPFEYTFYILKISEQFNKIKQLQISDRFLTLNLDSCFIKENEHNKYHTVGTVPNSYKI
jgi:hypothetical protein